MCSCMSCCLLAIESKIARYFLLLVVVTQLVAAIPLSVPCSGASEEGDKCVELETANGTTSGCSGGRCATSQQSVKKRRVLYDNCTSDRYKDYEPPFEHCRPNCTDKVCINDGFAKADIVLRGRVLRSQLFGVTHVRVVLLVQLVMRSITWPYHIGALSIYVPLHDNWMCDCPGRKQLRRHETYLITGYEEEIRPNLYRIVVDHRSIIRRWHETILVDILANKDQYSYLKLVPNLRDYITYIVPEEDHYIFD